MSSAVTVVSMSDSGDMDAPKYKSPRPDATPPASIKPDADVAALWDFDRSAESRDAQGGTSIRAQKEQVAALSAWLERTRDDGPSQDAVALVTEP